MALLGRSERRGIELTRGGVALASSRELSEGNVFDAPAPGEPAIAALLSPLGLAPTISPGGAPFALFSDPAPLAERRLSPGISGDPVAPGFPSGVAAKVPRRLPVGTSTGPPGATGCRFKATNLP